MENIAEVRLWGDRVGALALDPTLKINVFEYDPKWIAKGVEIAPLRMPLSPMKYQFSGLNPETYKGLPPLFSDVLPDDFGNAVIDAWLARNGRDVDSFTPIERLLYTGSRGMGALVFEPAMASTEPASKEIEIDSLVEMAQLILDERARLTTEIDTDRRNDDAMRMLFQVGTSAGGARAKALVAVNKDRTQIRSGQVDAPKGFEHYLLKFDGVDEHKTNSEVFGDPKGYGRMEYAYYLMAKNLGIDIQPSELLIDGPRAHFMTRRFDRKGNTRIHYVSLCAMDHADYKKAGSYSYEQLLTVARKLKLPRKDVVEIFRRMVFNVVARNHDDHTKNFGFTLNDRKSKWRLSPAFDLAYSYKKDSPWVNAHQMTITGKRDNFTHEDLLVIAGIIPNFNKKAKEIVNEVTDIVSDWDRYSKKADVPKGLSKEIKKNHRLNLTDK